MKYRLTAIITIFSILVCAAVVIAAGKDKAAGKSKDTETSELAVTMAGFKNTTGKIVVLLFTNDESFPKEEKAWKRVTGKITGSTTTVTVTGLPRGTYGISAYHDENNNDKLDTNWIGIPKEGCATSNNAKGSFGPPKFKDAKFAVDSDKVSMTIQVKYL